MRNHLVWMILAAGLHLPRAAGAAEPIAVFVIGADQDSAPALTAMEQRFKDDGRFTLRPWAELRAIMQAPDEAKALANERRAKLLDEAGARIREADRLLAQIEITKVMPELDKALEKMRRAVRGADLDALVALHVKRTSLAISLGSTRGVSDELKDILTIRPDFELDVELARPSVVRALEQARQATASRTVLSTMVLTQPRGATVVVDGKPAGETPTALRNLPAGLHLIEVSMPGCLDWARMVELSVDRTDPITIEMVYLSGSQLQNLHQRLTGIEAVETAVSDIDAARDDLGAGLVLFVEAGASSPVRLRLYDARQRAFSRLHTAAAGNAGLAAAIDSLLTELGPAGLKAPDLQRVVERVIERSTVEHAEPWYQKWWVWTGGAVLIVGASVAAAMLIEREGPPPLGFDIHGSIE